MENKTTDKQNLFFITEALYKLANAYEKSCDYQIDEDITQREKFKCDLKELMETLVDFLDERIYLMNLMRKSLSHFANMSEDKIVICVNTDSNTQSSCAFGVYLLSNSTTVQLKMYITAHQMHYAMKLYLSKCLSIEDKPSNETELKE